MKVRIIKSCDNAWYKGQIGNIFDVDGSEGMFFRLSGYGGLGIIKKDCEIVPDSMQSSKCGQDQQDIQLTEYRRPCTEGDFKDINNEMDFSRFSFLDSTVRVQCIIYISEKVGDKLLCINNAGGITWHNSKGEMSPRNITYNPFKTKQSYDLMISEQPKVYKVNIWEDVQGVISTGYVYTEKDAYFDSRISLGFKLITTLSFMYKKD